MLDLDIQRIPRLDRAVLYEVITRVERIGPRVCCYECGEPLMVGIPYRGRILCETDEQLAKLREFPARRRVDVYRRREYV